MWRDLILALDPEAICQPPAIADQLAQLEAILSMTLPGELADLLHEMNGAEVGYVSIVWSAEEIAQRNAELGRECQPGGMLFFGDRGNGDIYGFPITPEGVQNEIFL